MLRALTLVEKWKYFQRDWALYQKTIEYQNLLKAIEAGGIKKPYSENIMYRIYYAGYFKEPFIKS